MDKKKYKIALIGCGSIGKRHIRNMAHVLRKRNSEMDLTVIRSGYGKKIDDSLVPYINKVVSDQEEIEKDFDIIFVTNPTSLHYETIKKYVDYTKHMFIEKPIFHSKECCVSDISWKKNGIYYVACPMRYHEAIQWMKKNINIDEVYGGRCICSSYLPEWRPDSDYSKSYSAKKELGGGVSIDLIHEWDYLTYLFGMPEQMMHMQGKFSELDIETEDLSVYIGRYANRLIEVHLDYFGRESIRNIELFMKEDTIEVDLLTGKIVYKKSKKVVELESTRDGYQIRELEAFFDMIEGKQQNFNNVHHAMEIMKLITT